MMTIPDPLRRSAPRPVRLSGAGMMAAGVAFVLALAAPVAGVLLYTKAVRDAGRAALRSSQSVRAEGHVTDIQVRKGEKKRSIVTYTFDAAALRQKGTFRLKTSEVQARGLAVGSPVDVRYLPGNPTDNWVVGREPGGGQFWLAPLAGLPLLALAALIFVNIRRQISLLSYGRAAIAVATGSKRVRHEHGHTDKVLFDFRTLDGAVRKGSAIVHKVPPVGSEFVVVYDPDRPGRVARYPLTLVSAEQRF